MLRILSFCCAALLLSACNGGDQLAADPRQSPEPRDALYFRQNLDEAETQLAICKEIPSQARSEILEGNCVMASRAWARRDVPVKQPN